MTRQSGEAPKDTKVCARRVQQNGEGTKDGLRIQCGARARRLARLHRVHQRHGQRVGRSHGRHDNAAVFGIPTMTGDYIAEQMRAAGITADDNVLIVGYSQGGIHAQNIAASGEFEPDRGRHAGITGDRWAEPGAPDILRIESDETTSWKNAP